MNSGIFTSKTTSKVEDVFPGLQLLESQSQGSSRRKKVTLSSSDPVEDEEVLFLKGHSHPLLEMDTYRYLSPKG